MYKHVLKGQLFFLFITAGIVFLSSCKATKTVPYFADFPDSINRPTAIKTVPFKNPVIQPDDILSITLQTIDQVVSAPVNSANSTTGGTGSGAQASGYLVDKNGQVELPFIGKIKLSGLTISEAQDAVRVAADKLFNNPIVNVRLVNFKVTVLGEVNSPSSFTMPNEKVTIFDAIGLAGDLTITGKRENVLLVRDSTGDYRQMVRLNLNSKDIMKSPYFYLQPNDMIYVSPTRDRIVSSDVLTTRRITLITSSLSIVSLLIILISRL